MSQIIVVQQISLKYLRIEYYDNIKGESFYASSWILVVLNSEYCVTGAK